MSAPHTGHYAQQMEACPPPPTAHVPFAQMTPAERRASIEASVRKNSRLTNERLIMVLVNSFCERCEAFHARRRAETDATPEQPVVSPEAGR